jgi:hypothetical protein
MRPLFLSSARIGQLALCPSTNKGKRADSRLRRGKAAGAYQGKKDNRDSEPVVVNPSIAVPGTGAFTPIKDEAGITRFARPEGTYSVSFLISIAPRFAASKGFHGSPPRSVYRTKRKLPFVRTKPPNQYLIRENLTSKLD